MPTPRFLGVAIAVLLAAGTVAAFTRQPDDAHVTLTGGETSSTASTEDPALRPADGLSPSTTEGPTTTDSPSTTAGVVTPQTTSPPTTHGSASPADGITVGAQGLYVLDTATGKGRRIAEKPYPFDVAGGNVLVARGLDVYAVPVGGGGATRRYRMAKSPVLQSQPQDVDTSREMIVNLEAAPDGRAVVTAAVPTKDGNGWMTNTRLVAPDGEVLVDELNPWEAEWTDDGSLVALASYQGMSIHRADGTFVRALPVTDLTGVRWMADGSALVAVPNGGGPPARRIDRTTGATRALTGLYGVVDPGPGGRIAGLNGRNHAPDEFSSAGIGIYDPGANATRPVISSGWWMSWSLGGSHLAVLDKPVWRPGDPEVSLPWHLRVHAVDGDLEQRISPAPGLSLPYVSEGPALNWTGPQWSGDRYVVFAVVANGAQAMDAPYAA